MEKIVYEWTQIRRKPANFRTDEIFVIAAYKLTFSISIFVIKQFTRYYQNMVKKLHTTDENRFFSSERERTRER